MKTLNFFALFCTFVTFFCTLLRFRFKSVTTFKISKIEKKSPCNFYEKRESPCKILQGPPFELLLDCGDGVHEHFSVLLGREEHAALAVGHGLHQLLVHEEDLVLPGLVLGEENSGGERAGDEDRALGVGVDVVSDLLYSLEHGGRSFRSSGCFTISVVILTNP